MTKYVKTDGIRLNKENLPQILEQLAGKDYVKKIEVNKEERWIRIITVDNMGEFHYGSYIEILDGGVYPAFMDSKTYTAYYSKQVTEYFPKLYSSSNVLRIELSKNLGKLYVFTEKGNFSVPLITGVIVLDEDDEFIEMFESNKRTVKEAMLNRGYKVKE